MIVVEIYRLLKTMSKQNNYVQDGNMQDGLFGQIHNWKGSIRFKHNLNYSSLLKYFIQVLLAGSDYQFVLWSAGVGNIR